MVSGGPYGLEELLASSGYQRALIILVITPFVWSLPTTLMVGELAAALGRLAHGPAGSETAVLSDPFVADSQGSTIGLEPDTSQVRSTE